jgi:hypothetical protein
VIRRFVQTTTWRDMLIPLGAAILTAGVQHVQDRAAEQEGRLAELVELVAFRRDQLAGTRDLAAEPPEAPEAPELEPSSGGGWAIAAVVIVAAAAAVGIRKVWTIALDQFTAEEDQRFSPSLAAEVAAEVVREHLADLVDPVDQLGAPADDAPAPEGPGVDA